MSAYIKSHSNFRLNTRHQLVNGGVIYERDITTIGGVSPLGAGQSTIYSSGNFIITTNNETSPSRHIVKSNWLPNSNGETWNENVLANETSDINGSISSGITLTMLNDFMDLKSFACYGSLYMLIQNSIANIIDKFPYELYFDKSSQDGLLEETNTMIYEIPNPGNINLHTLYVNEHLNDPLKYFAANDNASNYVLIDNQGEVFDDFTWGINVFNEEYAEANDTPHDIALTKPQENIEKFKTLFFSGTTCVKQLTYSGITTTINSTFENGDVLYIRPQGSELVVTTTYCPKPYDCIAITTIENIDIYAIYNSDLQIVYYTYEDYQGYRLHPKDSLGFYDNFIESLAPFEKTLMGVYSHIDKTAQFNILSESDNGITQSTETFVFPSDLGGYNIASGGFNMTLYLQRLSKIALEYDEKYTDNLYRVATHESLKNFDWTRSFNGHDNDLDNEYVATGEKFKAIINIMGYIFDVEKGYIDCMNYANRITYNFRGNLSSYLLRDALSNDGWEINNIYPYTLTEFDGDGNEVKGQIWTQLIQSANTYKRQFNENVTDLVAPWAIKDISQIQECANGEYRSVLTTVDCDDDFYVKDNVAYNVIKNYYSATELAIPDINNEFLRRLKINSHHILRAKGTLTSIESLLSLLGFRNKKWYDGIVKEYGEEYASNKFQKDSVKFPYDFGITEYSVFGHPIIEQWDEAHNMYRIDYINSCKTIGYNTTEDDGYISYQGLPVAYRDVENQWLTPTGITTDEYNNDIYLDENGEKVKVRKLYPFFDSDSEYDGNMYYQMYGGWENIGPYSFSHDNVLCANSGNALYHETLRNISQVQNLEELVNLPTSNLYENTIYYVNQLTTNYAIIDGTLYQLNANLNEDGTTTYYFTVTVQNESVIIGYYQYTNILTVSDSDGETQEFNLNDLNDGFTIDIYYNPQLDSLFTISSNDDTEPNYMGVFINGAFTQDTTTATHYFQLVNAEAPDEIVGGWKQLLTDNPSYNIVNSIIDEYKGNNPHSGNLNYDSGYEYLSRFKQLFKYALEGDYFNYNCLQSTTDPTLQDIYAEIESYGFDGIAEDKSKYFECLSGDTKVHAYVDMIDTDGSISSYDLNDSSRITKTFNVPSENTDGVTAQIINTKIVKIDFYLQADNLYSQAGQEEVKYIQTKVLPYVEQMMPSTAILKIHFHVTSGKWVLDGRNQNGDTHPYGIWNEDYYWLDEGIWYKGQDDA